MGKKNRRFGIVHALQERAAPKRVVLAYPVGGSVTIAFHASVIRLVLHEMMKPPRRRLLEKVWHMKGLYIGDNRQGLAERFMERTALEWLLQIDTDVEFPPTILEQLLALAGDDKDVLTASVPLGQYASSAFMRTEKPGVWQELTAVPTSPIEVEGVGTACCLIRRRVFERIADRHGQCWFHHIYVPKEGEPGRGFKYNSQGEDLSFSVRAAEAGFRLWAVHIPGMRHHKTKALSHDDERAIALAAEDSAIGEMVQEG